MFVRGSAALGEGSLRMHLFASPLSLADYHHCWPRASHGATLVCHGFELNCVSVLYLQTACKELCFQRRKLSDLSSLSKQNSLESYLDGRQVADIGDGGVIFMWGVGSGEGGADYMTAKLSERMGERSSQMIHIVIKLIHCFSGSEMGGSTQSVPSTLLTHPRSNRERNCIY